MQKYLKAITTQDSKTFTQSLKKFVKEYNVSGNAWDIKIPDKEAEKAFLQCSKIINSNPSIIIYRNVLRLLKYLTSNHNLLKKYSNEIWEINKTALSHNNGSVRNDGIYLLKRLRFGIECNSDFIMMRNLIEKNYSLSDLENQWYRILVKIYFALITIHNDYMKQNIKKLTKEDLPDENEQISPPDETKDKKLKTYRRSLEICINQHELTLKIAEKLKIPIPKSFPVFKERFLYWDPEEDFEQSLLEHLRQEEFAEPTEINLQFPTGENPETSQNPTQEFIRKFWQWFNKRRPKYEKEIDFLINTFWENRADLKPIEQNTDTEQLFFEWLMLDAPVNEFIEIEERFNFCSLFIKEEWKNLSDKAQFFGKNMSESVRDYYQVTNTKSGMFANLKRLRDGKKIQVWDVTLSKAKFPKDYIVFGRFAENEKGKFISSGGSFQAIPKEYAEILLMMMKEVFQMTQFELNVSNTEEDFLEFLKWNSYIYMREIFSTLNLCNS